MLARRPASLLAAALVACAPLGCGAPEVQPPPPPSPDPPPRPAPSFQPAAVSPTLVGEGTITRIEKREQVALTGPRVDAKPGDWLLENAGSVAVVAADGRVIDLGSKGGRDEITAISPALFLGLGAAHFEIDRIEPVGEGGRVLHVVRRALEKPLFLHAFIAFQGDRLRIETAATLGAPSAAPLAVTLGEQIGWGNVPTWASGHGFITRGGVFATEFLARESFGVAYALCSESGRMLARFDPPDSGFHEEASTGETPENLPLDAPGSRRFISVTHASGSLGRAALALPCLKAGLQHVRPSEGLPKEAHVEVARCSGGGPFARFLPDESDLALPEGCFQMRLTAPGHTTSHWFPAASAAGRALPPSGRLHFAVTDQQSGKPLPARILVRGQKGQVDPDWGDDPDAGAALNIVYSETGEGERSVPPGKYKVTIDRGFEYTAFEKDVEITAGRTTAVSTTLDRVVDTKGFIAADLHLHAMPSPDATQPLADKIRALVATGVEVGVATDHNKITDYKPTIQELKVGQWITSVIGDEITSREPAYGHFNAFPLPAGSEPVPYKGVSPKQLFAAARASGGPDTIVQVNHPRMGGIGYFELLRFDRDDLPAWARRVNLADMSFDAIEVFNGDHYAIISKVEECLRDWYALLNAGYRFTATGNSDSHKMSYHEPGVPRNLVAVPSDDPAAFDERAFVDALKKGRVVVSSGPFIRLEIGGKGVGETVPAGEVEVSLIVDAPPWVDVDKVELVRRGEVVEGWSGPYKTGKSPHRFEMHPRVTLKKGDWIIAVARGSKPMSYLYRPNARPFAFTNPIWVD